MKRVYRFDLGILEHNHSWTQCIIKCVARRIVPAIIVLLIQLLVIGCGVTRKSDSEYLLLFREIEGSSYNSVYAIDPEYIKELLVESSEKMELSSGLRLVLVMLREPDGPIVTLEKWIREAESIECEDQTLIESKAYLVDGMKDEVGIVYGIVELMNESTKGMSRDEITKQMDELYDKGAYGSSKFEKAKQKVETYENRN